MTRIDLIPPGSNDVIERFEEACRELGLRIHRGSLEKYPESMHWHLTIPKQKGTLEATWWPTNHALWMEGRKNRQADWMLPVVEALMLKFG